MNYFRKLRLLGLQYLVGNLVYKLNYKLGFSSSKTVFLSYESSSVGAEIGWGDTNFKVVELTLESLASLEKILVFNEVIDNAFFNDDKRGAFVVLNGEDEVIAFSFYDLNKQHVVNGWVSVEVGEDTAWVGPVFVHPTYRGNKLNKVLYFAIFKFLSGKAHKFITCINSSNQASIKSHEAMGFVKIGEVVRSKHQQPIANSFNAAFENMVRML